MNREKLECQIKCIFNKPDLSKIQEEDDYIWWLITKYGCIGYDFEKCIEIAKGHEIIKKTVNSYNLGVSNYDIIDFAMRTMR